MSIKKIISVFILFLFLPGLAFSIPVSSQKLEAQKELVQLLSGIHSMWANFEQISTANKSTYAHGVIAFLKPGKFYWQSEGQTKQLIVANGSTVWIYDADLQQATKRKINYADSGNPAMLLSGSPDVLQNMFKVTKVDMLGVGQWFELRSRANDASYEWLRLHFIEGKLIAMHMKDNLGRQNKIKFNNIKINPPKLAQNLFVFTPPKDVDVIQ